MHELFKLHTTISCDIARTSTFQRVTLEWLVKKKKEKEYSLFFTFLILYEIRGGDDTERGKWHHSCLSSVHNSCRVAMRSNLDG